MAIAKERHQIKSYPTPLPVDLVFYEIFDSTLPANEGFSYGDSYARVHDGSTLFPNHKLVLVAPMPKDDKGLQLWYFAADRDNQDNYNWEFTQGQELVRTYLIRRDLYYARTAAEAAVASPLVAGEFPRPIVAALDSRFSKYGFADDTLLEAPQELKSLFVVIRRRYLEPVTVEVDHDQELNIRFKVTRTLVPAETGVSSLPADSLGYSYQLQPVNTFHSVQIKREPLPDTSLSAYADVEPCRVQIQDLPRELLSVNVVWNEAHSIGTQDFQFAKVTTGDNWTLTGSGSDQASSSASITAEIQVKFRDIETGNLFGNRHTFFLPCPVTEAQILTRLATVAHVGGSVTKWPVFRPETTTISTTGQGIKVNVNASAGLAATNSDGVITMKGYDEGTSDDYSVSMGNNSVQIGPCIHGALSFTGGTYNSSAVAATATISIYHSVVGTITATKTKSGTAYGEVSPTSLDATAGTNSIPTSGNYLMDYNVRKYDLGYAEVTAIVFDASNLA